jgi:hypothetical protein
VTSRRFIRWVITTMAVLVIAVLFAGCGDLSTRTVRFDIQNLTASPIGVQTVDDDGRQVQSALMSGSTNACTLLIVVRRARTTVYIGTVSPHTVSPAAFQPDDAEMWRLVVHPDSTVTLSPAVGSLC